MNSERIITQNFYAPGRGYFGRVVVPSLEATQQLSKPTIQKYIIAGKHIHIFIYTKSSGDLFHGAFTHHEPSTQSNPDLVIYAWDATITRETLTPPWQDIDYQNPTEQSDPNFFGVYVGGEESLSFYDTTTKTGYFWMQDASQLSDWSTGAPFRAILHWFLNTHNIHLVHGAVIGSKNKSVLVTAKSGSGKSTTALASLLAGMDYLADDYSAIELQEKPIAYSLYNSAKITRKGLSFFPELEPLVWNKNFSGNEKAVVFLSQLFPHQVKLSAPLSAILIPRIVGGETTITPVSKVQALIAIAPTTMLQLPLAHTNKLTVLKNIIDQVPCYYLNLGDTIQKIPAVIKNFLNNDIL